LFYIICLSINRLPWVWCAFGRCVYFLQRWLNRKCSCNLGEFTSVLINSTQLFK
jgi:hypothetical protein